MSLLTSPKTAPRLPHNLHVIVVPECFSGEASGNAQISPVLSLYQSNTAYASFLFPSLPRPFLWSRSFLMYAAWRSVVVLSSIREENQSYSTNHTKKTDFLIRQQMDKEERETIFCSHDGEDCVVHEYDDETEAPNNHLGIDMKRIMKGTVR